MRINKLFSNYGICSRKETNILIEDGRVLVNGSIATPGQWVCEEDIILLDNKPLTKKAPIYIALNKPRGILCSSANNLENNIIDFMELTDYVFPIGRLDKDSEGLILLTNDGDFANDLINSENNHQKEYLVTVDSDFDQDFLDKMMLGVPILSTITRPCILKRVSSNTFTITLTQGLNRQIRRMCSYFGYKVVSLKRIRILNLTLGDLPYGKFRYLTLEEVDNLRKLL